MESNIVNKNNSDNFENIEESKKYILLKDNKTYKFKVFKKKHQLLIKTKKYEAKIGYVDLQILTKSVINSIDEAFNYFVSLFEEQRVQIKEKEKKMYIKLLLTIYSYNKEKKIDFILKYKDCYKMLSILNLEILNLQDIIANYQEQNKKLKNENEELKKNIIIFEKQNQNLEYENKILNNYIFNYQAQNQNLENEIYGLKKTIYNYQVENQNLENEIEILKNNSNNNYENSINFYYYYSNIKPNKIIKDSFADENLDNTFSIFKSINNQLYLIYANKSKSIIVFDIIGNQKINEIKNAHNFNITNFRHYWDKINNRDLIMSISCNDNNLKVWDFKNWQCICSIENINNTGSLNSACIFKDNNQNLIITSNDTENDMNEEQDTNLNPEPIKIYDFNGNKIKELNDSKLIAYIVDTYYNTKKKKTYIITGNKGFIQSYDYEKNKRYLRFSEYPKNINETEYGNCSFIVNHYKNMTRLFETCWDGNIRIWNFDIGELIFKMKINCMQGICLSDNNKYLYVGCENNITIINLKKRKKFKSFKAHKNKKEILTIKRISHPKKGEILISQGAEDGQIRFWSINDIINAY